MKYNAIRVMRYCRFGNNIYQLHNAIAFARFHGIQTVYIDTLFTILELNPAFQVCALADGMRIVANKPINQEGILSHKFFYPHEFGATDLLNNADSKTIFSEISKSILYLKDCGTSNYIHAHIRSGDIFIRRRPKINYTQPPLAYYQKAILNNMASGRYKGVVVVFEDSLNPVSTALLSWLAAQGIHYKVQSSKFAQDFRQLITAKCIIAGKGSLLPMIACLSGKVEKFCIFRKLDIPILFNKCGITVEAYYDSDGAYIAPNNWRISALKGDAHNNQLRQLIEYPICNIICSQ